MRNGTPRMKASSAAQSRACSAHGDASMPTRTAGVADGVIWSSSTRGQGMRDMSSFRRSTPAETQRPS